MSLDIDLRHCETGEYLYETNITHNLNKMAQEAGIYEILWRPDEIGITKASQIIEPLSEGVAKLACNKSHYQKFDAENGWGLWEHFLPFCANYLQACKDFPDAIVEVSR